MPRGKQGGPFFPIIYCRSNTTSTSEHIPQIDILSRLKAGDSVHPGNGGLAVAAGAGKEISLKGNAGYGVHAFTKRDRIACQWEMGAKLG